MAEVVKKNKRQYWVDANGDLVPVKYISSEEKLQDELVSSALNKVMILHEELARFKARIIQYVDSHLDQFAEKYGEKWVGNAKITDFASKNMIEIMISKKIGFNNYLQLAKQKIDAYIKEKTKKADRDIVSLIMKAFAVDKKGFVDHKQIIGLRQISIDHPLWKEAMDLVDKGLIVEETKRYFVFKQKDDQGLFKTISLNFSAIDSDNDNEINVNNEPEENKIVDYDNKINQQLS